MDNPEINQVIPPIIEPEIKEVKPHIGGLNTNPENINRSGRPKKELSMVDMLKKQLVKCPKDKKIKYKKLIAKMLVALASEGNVKAIKEVFDRIDGKPKQSLDVTSNGQTLIKQELTRLGDLIDELSPNPPTK